jgi:hypothetical protein
MAQNQKLSPLFEDLLETVSPLWTHFLAEVFKHPEKSLEIFRPSYGQNKSCHEITIPCYYSRCHSKGPQKTTAGGGRWKSDSAIGAEGRNPVDCFGPEGCNHTLIKSLSKRRKKKATENAICLPGKGRRN